MDAVVFFRFGYFLTTEDILKYNLGMGKELGEIHKWDLIMIARGDTDPYSHVFLGIGEHNKDKIFYVNTQALPDDQVINTNGIGSSDGHFIKYIAKDVFQFARTLNFARINEDVIW